MKIFEMIDEESGLSLGALLYYEKEKTYIVELQEYLDEWNAPLLFTAYVKKHIYTIPRDVSFMWVKERVIPSGRQNIASILANHGLQAYDEMKFLELSEGKCSQDKIYIKKVKELPEYVKKRQIRNVVECVALSDNTVLCFFTDEKVKKIDLTKLVKVDDVDKIIKNEMLFQSVKVGTGGYFITFNDSIDIPSALLYESGEDIALKLEDFKMFIRKNIFDTSEACNVLECSRQNVAYMVNQKRIIPVKEEVRGNLYLKGDVIRNKW